MSTSESAFVVKGNDDTEGSQIDLIIERKDGIVNMCEMKFYNSDYTVTKAYERKIVERYNLVTGLISKKSCVNPVLITTFGLEPPGQKNEGEGAVARERSDRRGLGKPFPNQ